MINRFERFNSGRAMFFLIAIITVIFVGAVLKLASSVMLPFTISVFLAIVTSPIVKLLEKLRIPRILSIILLVCALMGVLIFTGIVLISSSRVLLVIYPRYEARFTEIYIWLAQLLELPYNEHLSFIENLWGQLGVRNRVMAMTFSISNALLTFLTDAFLVAIFMTFILIEASFFREKLDRAFEGRRAEQIKNISSGVFTQIARYLSLKFVISLFTGVVVGVGLSIVGVEFAIVWGVIQFVLNFIPNIGSIAVGMAATVFSLVQFWPEPAPVIATGFIMLGANMIIGNVIEPKITGDRLGLSPLVVLVSLLAWGWIWGFTGLILAVPMMAIIKITCENIPVLEPIAILMGSHKAAAIIKSEEETVSNDICENKEDNKSKNT